MAGGDDELMALLQMLESAVQPALLLHEHGLETLANSIESLLQGRPSDLVTLVQAKEGGGRNVSPIREHSHLLTAEPFRKFSCEDSRQWARYFTQKGSPSALERFDAWFDSDCALRESPPDGL